VKLPAGWVRKELGMQFQVRPLDTQTFAPSTIDFLVVQDQTIVLERVEKSTRRHAREDSVRCMFNVCTRRQVMSLDEYLASVDVNPVFVGGPV
jgi:hypothetical protein